MSVLKPHPSYPFSVNIFSLHGLVRALFAFARPNFVSMSWLCASQSVNIYLSIGVLQNQCTEQLQVQKIRQSFWTAVLVEKVIGKTLGSHTCLPFENITIPLEDGEDNNKTQWAEMEILLLSEKLHTKVVSAK